MAQPLRVLHLEDNPGYSDLVSSRLTAEGFLAELTRVETREDFQAALEQGGFDLIIADYFLPTYDGLKALALAQEKQPEIPILLVSGTIGEEAAIESLKAGATDYVLKHWPERLIPAVRRALREAEERKNRLRAETTLIRREKHFRAVSENSLDIVSLLDRTGVFTYNSLSLQRVIGYSPQDLIGQSAFSLVHPDDLARVQEDFRRCMENPELTSVSKFRVRHQNGSWRHLESICKSFLDDPEVAGIVVNSRDVTERQRIEHYNSGLSALGLKLSSAITAEEAAAVIVETAGDIFGWDACALNLYSPDEDKIYPILSMESVRGKPPEIARPEKDKSPTAQTRRVLNQGAELILREKAPENFAAPDGEKPPPASLMIVPVRNGTRVIGILSIQSHKLRAYDEKDLGALQAMADYCGGALERIRVERELRESERRFRQLFEDSPDAVFVDDTNGIVLDANLAAARLQGMSREELVGKNVLDLVPHYQREEVQQRFQKMVRGEMRQAEGIGLAAGGREFPAEVRTSLIDYAGKPALLLHVRDITERRRLEEQLRQSQKMDAIGQLAGGVAHDFNNILTVIQGHAMLLRSSSERLGAPSVSAEQIVQASERAAGLTRQLLAFSRRQMMQPRQLDLNNIVSNMTKMLGRILGEDIALQFNYSPNLPLVHADAGMIEQVLLNLAVNSRDAMPSGGQLTIRILVLALKPDDLKHHPEGRPGDFACLSVEDTGCGIEPKILARIFEPFFTTKEVGKGTGLGLATVYGIVKQHQGWVEVESQVGRGTTFHVYLPCLRETSSAVAPETMIPEAVRGGTETILVVEDEEAVRELVCHVLKGCGYTVLEAATGVEALKVWQLHKDEIDLLLTDIVMPDGMTGRDLAEKVQAEKPGLKAIFTSGYSADIVGKDFMIHEGVNYLQKPYVPQKLMRAVRKGLDGR